MEYRILGPVEVVGGVRAIRLGSRRERAVLAALVLGRGDVVAVDRLVDALWGDEPPRSAGKTLQNYILKLRKALGAGSIETQSPGYRINADAAVIDVSRFDEQLRLVAAARADGRPEDAVAAAREALGLWRGDPLDELRGWPTADTEVARLTELRRVLAEDLADAELACGRAAPIVADLEAMVVEEPLRERRWSLLMFALYRGGRQADALRTYQRARTLLGDELGIEPGPELRALERAIAAQDPSLELDCPVAGAGDGSDEHRDVDDADACPPYLGLAAFGAKDSDRFFGRTELVAAIVERTKETRFLAVVGASGSGKSSVVRAGVLASLRAGALPGSETWPSVVITPGGRPMVELAVGLAPVVGRSPAEVLDILGAGPGGLGALARATASEGRLVVVVDQFEELFTSTRDEGERRAFVEVLAGPATDARVDVTVIVAIRADFYGHCAAIPTLATLVDDASMLLRPMAPDEIRAAVEGPARLAGLDVEPGLTELVVRDVGEEPGALPLLSHALLETWSRRTHRKLTVAGYRAAGGVHGAIAQTAESVYRTLDGDRQVRARRIFLRLTQLGDGTEDTSRRVTLDELFEAADRDDVLQVLTAARLVTVDRGTVQVAHEALIREWPRLRAWVDEDRDGHRIHRHLTHAAQDWETLGREPTELYRGPRLAAVTDWLAHDDRRAALNAVESDFVDASVDATDRERIAADEVVRARERSNRRLRRLLAGVAVMLVLALVAGALAVIQRDRADREADASRRTSEAAEIQRLVAQSAALRGENQYVSALLALEANAMRDDARTEGALLSAVVAEPRRIRTIPTGTSEGVWGMADGRVLVLSHGRLGLWDVEAGIRRARLPVDGVEGAAVRADGMIAAATTAGTVEFFTAAGRPAGPAVRTGLHGPIASAAFSPDGDRLALAYGDWTDARPVAAARTVALLDVERRVVEPALDGTTAPVTALAISHDGRLLALGAADDTVTVRDLAGGSVRPPITVAAPPIGLAFDPARDRLAIGTVQPVVTVVDPTTGEVVGKLADAPPVDAPVYDPAGDVLAVAGDGPVRLYDAATLGPLPNPAAFGFSPAVPVGEPLDAQTSRARAAFVGGGRLVIGGSGGPATVWDPRGISALDRLVPGALTYVFPMADGSRLAAPDLEDSVTLYDARTLQPLGPPLTPGPGASASLDIPAAFAASYYDGSRIAVLNQSGTLQLFATASRRPIGPAVETGVSPVYAVFSRDMRTIAVGGRRGEVRLVDVRTHRVRALPSPMTNYVFGLEFGPHGRLAASDAGHVVVFSRLGARHPRMLDVSRATGAVGFGMDLSPDGRVLATTTGSGTIGFYDARTLHRLGSLVPVSGNTVNWVAFDRSGTRLVTGDVGNFARLVDVRSHQAIGPPLGNNIAGSGSVFSHDGRSIGTWTFAGGALMSTDPTVWRHQACLLAGRNLTRAEWAKYLPGDGPRRRTCSRYA